MNPGNPLYAASHMQNLANRAGNDKLAFAINGLSVVLLAKMVYDEFKAEFRGKEKKERGRG